MVDWMVKDEKDVWQFVLFQQQILHSPQQQIYKFIGSVILKYALLFKLNKGKKQLSHLYLPIYSLVFIIYFLSLALLLQIVDCYNKMMKQSQKIDTIKLYVHLISKLKKQEDIDLSNKLLSTQVKNITNKSIKLMLEIQSIHHENYSQEDILELQQTLLAFRAVNKPDTQDYKLFSLLLLKLHSICLLKTIKSNKQQDIQKLSQNLLTNIRTIEEFRYILQVMFHIRSVLALQKVDIAEIEAKYTNRKEMPLVFSVIALVKATINTPQAMKIFQKIKQNPSILSESKQLISLLGQLGKKQRELLSSQGNEESVQKSLLQGDNSSKKVIKNSIESECKFLINQTNKQQTFNRINVSLDENLYLYAFPLTHLYYEQNEQIIESVKSTQLYKYIITSKSFLVQNNLLNNSNGSYLQLSKSKSKKRPKKNPAFYEIYVAASLNANKNLCIPVCQKGLMFIKHNYGNLNSSHKFVKVSDSHLSYYKSSEATDSGTRWQLSEVLGVLYGKVTSRQLQNTQDSQCCCSIILKDRSLDLSVESKERVPQLLNFIRGLSSIINEYHFIKKEKAEERLQASAQVKKNKLKQLHADVVFHEGKIQKLSRGRMLWSSLFLSLNAGEQNIEQQSKFMKLSGIKRVILKQSSKPLKK